MKNKCELKQMAGWFEDPKTGQFNVQYLVEPPASATIRVPLPARSRHSLEVTVDQKHLRDAMQEAKMERRSRTVLPPRKRSQRDVANPVISAQTRKYYAGSRWDKGRYKTEEKETSFSPRRQRAAGSFLFKTSPLKKDQPVTPATPDQPVLPQSQPTVTALPAPQKRRGLKKKKSKKKRTPGPTKRVRTRKQADERRKKKLCLECSINSLLNVMKSHILSFVLPHRCV